MLNASNCAVSKTTTCVVVNDAALVLPRATNWVPVSASTCAVVQADTCAVNKALILALAILTRSAVSIATICAVPKALALTAVRLCNCKVLSARI